MCILYVVSSIPTYVVRSYLRHLVAKEVTAPAPAKYPLRHNPALNCKIYS